MFENYFFMSKLLFGTLFGIYNHPSPIFSFFIFPLQELAVPYVWGGCDFRLGVYDQYHWQVWTQRPSGSTENKMIENMEKRKCIGSWASTVWMRTKNGEKRKVTWGVHIQTFLLWCAQKIEKRGGNKLNYNTAPTKILNNDKVF